jgi:hypothetical protein
MKKLSPTPNSSLISRVTVPLMTSTAILSSMVSCDSIIVGEPYSVAGESSTAGDDASFIGEYPFAGNDQDIGESNQPGSEDSLDMGLPTDVDLYEQDQSVAGSESFDMATTDLEEQDFGVQDFGFIDMANDEPDAELNVGLPPERDSGIDQPGREEPGREEP